MTRGRKSTIDAAQVDKIFVKYAATCRNTKISYNHPIFKTIAQELNSEVTPYSLFMRLKRNFNSIFGKEYVPNNEESPLAQSISSPSSRSIVSSPTKCASAGEGESAKEFTFLLDVHDWKKVEPLYVSYVRRDPGTASTHKKYKTLPKHKWASLLREKLWEFTRLPCTWVFKNKRVYDDKNVLIHGKCSQCSCISEITSEAATDKTVKMTCTLFNTDNGMPHNPNKKSKLTPYKRRQLGKKLQYKPATVVHKEIASAILKDDDNTNSPVLPTMEALRKVKHEKRQSNRLYPNAILSILMMSIIATYQNFIREFTLVPSFRLCYWCEQQAQYYKAYIEKIPQVTMTMDATGSFFRTIKLPDGSLLTKRMFLYVAMVTSSTLKSTAICQLITDSHTTDSILSWLKIWYNEVRTAPKEIITDDSSAFIAANVQAFTMFQTVRDYLRQSFLVLMNKSSNVPPVFIRLDTSHFVKNVYNLRCFDNVEMNIKMFYIRCILFVKECESFEIIQNVICHIIKICTTKYDFTNNEACTMSMNYVKTLISKIEQPVIENEKEEFSDDYVEISDDEGILYWFDELLKRSKVLEQTISTSAKANHYYLPNLISTLKRLMMKLPLWSNVMCPIYKSENKSPTSSAIESYFKTLKTLVFETRLHKYNVDEFLKIHFNYLLGETRIAAKSLNINDKLPPTNKQAKKERKRKLHIKKKMQSKKVKRNMKQSFPLDSIFTETPSYTENWRGEGYNTDINNTSVVLFLRNCNVVKSVNKNVNITNTCALDSVFFLLAFAYKQNVHVKQIFDTCKNELIRGFIKIMTECSNLKAAYKLREEIIMSFYESQNNIYVCDSNMAFIFEHILLDIIHSAISIKECLTETCADCLKRTIAFLPINTEIINVFGIKGLEDAIIFDDFDLKICFKCKNKTSRYRHEYCNILLFDLNGLEKIKLEDVPHHIQIKQTKFRLIGALEYISPVVGPVGHYKCHCLEGNSTMICYDDNDTKIRASSELHLTIHNLTYGLIDDD